MLKRIKKNKEEISLNKGRANIRIFVELALDLFPLMWEKEKGEQIVGWKKLRKWPKSN